MGAVQLEIDGEEEVGGGVLPEARTAECGSDAVLFADEHVVEEHAGAKPIDAGEAEQLVRDGQRLVALPVATGEVAVRTQVEEIPRR